MLQGSQRLLDLHKAFERQVISGYRDQHPIRCEDRRQGQHSQRMATINHQRTSGIQVVPGNPIFQFAQDAGKGDCAGCTFLFRTAAEIRVMTSPIGKGSMNVIAALRNGLSYSSLYFFTC